MTTKTLINKEAERDSYSERTQISLSKSQKERIKVLQQALGVSMSEIIRQAVDLLSKSLEKDKNMTKGVLRKTAGVWKGRKFTGMEYEKKLRNEEEKKLKEIGIG